MHALIVTFRLDGITHEEFLEGCDQRAPAFAAVPGLVSKTWLADAGAGRYGGLYVFETEAGAMAYLASDLFRGGVADNPAFTGLDVRTAAVAEGPTRVTAADRRSPASAAA